MVPSHRLTITPGEYQCITLFYTFVLRLGGNIEMAGPLLIYMYAYIYVPFIKFVIPCSSIHVPKQVMGGRLDNVAFNSFTRHLRVYVYFFFFVFCRRMPEKARMLNIQYDGHGKTFYGENVSTSCAMGNKITLALSLPYQASINGSALIRSF